MGRFLPFRPLFLRERLGTAPRYCHVSSAFATIGLAARSAVEALLLKKLRIRQTTHALSVMPNQRVESRMHLRQG